MKEAWEEELAAEVAKRKKAKAFLTLAQLRKKYDLLSAVWDDYHEGDATELMALLTQAGYPHAKELSYCEAPEAYGKYLFVYSKKAISKALLKKIEYALGADLNQKYNLVWHD